MGAHSSPDRGTSKPPGPRLNHTDDADVDFLDRVAAIVQGQAQSLGHRPRGTNSRDAPGPGSRCRRDSQPVESWRSLRPRALDIGHAGPARGMPLDQDLDSDVIPNRSGRYPPRRTQGQAQSPQDRS